MVEKFILENLKKYTNLVEEQLICIDYVESEQGKNLYANQSGDNPETGEYIEKKVPITEIEILKAPHDLATPATIRRIVEIDSSEVTEKEKAEYVNMINPDIYIRRVIYDTKKENRVSYFYYKDEDKQMIDYFKNALGYNETKAIKVNNEDIANNVKVPTIAEVTGICYLEEGKYIVDLHEHSFHYVSSFKKSKRAQELISANTKRNEEIKNWVEKEISEVVLIKDKDEDYIIKEEKEDSVDITEGTIKPKLENRDIIVFASIGVAILICLILLIINIKRRKGKN